MTDSTTTDDTGTGADAFDDAWDDQLQTYTFACSGCGDQIPMEQWECEGRRYCHRCTEQQQVEFEAVDDWMEDYL